MVYRIYVDSAKRRSGHQFDFEYDITGVVTSRYLVGKTWMAAVEWCTPVRYSASSSVFAKDAAAPGTVLLTCPEFAAENTLDAWTGSSSPTLCALQNYAQLGYYGLTADTPYLRRAHLGCLVTGDRLQQAGRLRFRLVAPKMSSSTVGFYTLLQPGAYTNGTTVYGADFQFSLVLWEPTPGYIDRSMTPTYPYYKLWLSSRSRTSGGSSVRAQLPFRFPVNGDMSTGMWRVVVESFSLLTHGVTQANVASGGVAVVCNELAADSLAARPNVIGFLGRSYRAGETQAYGQVLTIKPACSDAVGRPVRAQLDRLSSLTIELLDAATLQPPLFPGLLSEWVCCLTFFRVK